MRVAIATVQVPFIRGGAEALAEGLLNAFRQHGHEADIVTIPFKWYPPATLLECMVMGRKIDLTEVNGQPIDLVVALKFPVYYLRHPNKVVWLLHQHRQAYDLWGTEYGDLHLLAKGQSIRRMIIEHDQRFLREAREIFTISEVVSDRLRRYNDLSSIPLYPPPPNFERLHRKSYEPFIFYPSRIDAMKRQRILVEAARHLKSDVRIVIAGRGDAAETELIRGMISDYGLEHRIHLTGYISEEDKVDLYSRCLAVYFGGYDEDFGYVPVESLLSHKPVVTFPDGGEALQFVHDGETGYVASDASQFADRIDRLALESGLARRLGDCGFELIRRKNITWEHVVSRLTGSIHG